MSSVEKSRQNAASDVPGIDNPRREAIRKIGKYSAYTAPALLALLTPRQGRAAVMSAV